MVAEPGAKSEPKLVKEVTLAREETPPPAPAPEPPKEDESNPVEKSSETHCGGWAMFFSSRALGMNLIAGAGKAE